MGWIRRIRCQASPVKMSTVQRGAKWVPKLALHVHTFLRPIKTRCLLPQVVLVLHVLAVLPAKTRKSSS